MALTYQVPILEDGRITLEDAALKKGMTVKVTVSQIRRKKPAKSEFRKKMEAFIKQCAANDPHKDLSDEALLALLRRQREEWDDTETVEEILAFRESMGYRRR